MIVADASVVLDLLLGGGSEAGETLAGLLAAGRVVAAPHLIDAEVAQGLRRYALRGELSDAEARSLLVDLFDVPVRRYPHVPLLARAFEFRRNTTVYDGLYLTLAETLEVPFLTGDAALRQVPGCRAVVQVVATG